MVEENKQEIKQEEVKPLSKIERAELAAKRLEEAEKRLDEKISKLTELQTDKLLGSSAGGHIEPQPVKPQSAKEYAEAVLGNKIPAK